MEPSAERPVICPICGARNYQGAALCSLCGGTLPLTQPPVVSLRPPALRLPVAPGPTWVSWGLVAINVLVWLAMTAAGGSTNGQVLLDFGAKYGPAILAGEYWRLLTPIFLHIGLMHLAFNSYALYWLGAEAEKLFGRPRFLATYLLAGVSGNATSYLLDSSLAAGASGAIFGLVGALAAFFIRGRKLLGALGRRRLGNLASIVLINLVIGFTVPNIDNMAHLGGLVAGFLVGWVLAPEYTLVPPGPAGPARIVDANSLARRWWVVPAALGAVAVLTLVGNLRESNTGSGYQQRGEQQMAAGEWAAAVDSFTKAIERDPDLWSAYVLRGEVYLQGQNTEAALGDFERVIEARPAAQHLALAYTGRGRVLMLRGEAFLALVDLNQAVSLDPEEPFARFVRGLIHWEMGNVPLATADLQAALDLGLHDARSEEIARQALATLQGQAD